MRGAFGYSACAGSRVVVGPVAAVAVAVADVEQRMPAPSGFDAGQGQEGGVGGLVGGVRLGRIWRGYRRSLVGRELWLAVGDAVAELVSCAGGGRLARDDRRSLVVGLKMAFVGEFREARS